MMLEKLTKKGTILACLQMDRMNPIGQKRYPLHCSFHTMGGTKGTENTPVFAVLALLGENIWLQYDASRYLAVT